MKWVEILRKDGYALLQSESDMQYCVACGYDPTQPEDQQWRYGTYFTYENDKSRKAESLSNALEHFRYETENDYVSRSRLEKLATLFKDELLENSTTDALEYFEEVCNMSDEEKEFFGIFDKMTPIEFSIKRDGDHYTETYFTYIIPDGVIEIQVGEVLRKSCFCDEYRVVGFREVSDSYVKERRKIIEKYEAKHGKGSVEEDFTMGEIISLQTLKNEMKGE